MITDRPLWILISLVLAAASCAPQPAPSTSAPAASAPKSPAATAKKTPVAATVNRPESRRVNGRGKVSSISLTDFFEQQQADKVLLFDARPAFFYKLGHIPGAISLPKNDRDARIAQYDADIQTALADGKTIVIYCTNLLCPDARTVAIRLADSGYPSSTLTGGWDSYKETGLPTE